LTQIFKTENLKWQACYSYAEDVDGHRFATRIPGTRFRLTV